MKDQDTIKAGVELADGWKMDETVYGTVVIVPPFLTPEEREGLQGWILSSPHQGITDALAAQLVRQVDALTDYHFITDESEAAAVVAQGGGNVSFGQDDDRTMNTLKCIIDSGVLK